MKRKFFDLAAKVARLSEHPQFRMGAVLVSGNRVLSVGVNKNKTHPKSNNIWRTIHAELDCAFGVDADDLHGTTLYVARIKKDGSFGISRPCAFCACFLRDSGIRRVYYCDGENTFGELDCSQATEIRLPPAGTVSQEHIASNLRYSQYANSNGLKYGRISD